MDQNRHVWIWESSAFVKVGGRNNAEGSGGGDKGVESRQAKVELLEEDRVGERRQRVEGRCQRSHAPLDRFVVEIFPMHSKRKVGKEMADVVERGRLSRRVESELCDDEGAGDGDSFEYL